MTRIEVDVEEGRARCSLSTGLLSPRVLSCDDTGARVALVATSALLLAGDAVRIDVRVGPGAWLHVVETSGTVAYDARGGTASWDVTIEVAAGGILVWEGLPFVVAVGADVTRATTAELGTGATLLLRETLVLGRTGEVGGDLRSGMRCSLDGSPALVDDLRLDASRTAPGILGDERVVDSVLCLGMRPPATAPSPGRAHLDLDVPGALVRSLGRDAHTGSLDAVWGQWLAHVAGAPRPGAAEPPAVPHPPPSQPRPSQSS